MNAKRELWPSPTRALTIYAVIFSVFITWASLRTLANPGPHGASIRCLAAVEIAGALLFVFRRTRLVGLVTLLAVFAVATAIELHLHELPLRFVFYAASALLVQNLSVHLYGERQIRGTSHPGTPSSRA